MKSYFEKMTEFGQALNPGRIKSSEENVGKLQEIEAELKTAVDKVRQAGFPEEKINARGQMTVYQRLRYLVDPGTWVPLHSLYNPEDNVEGTNNVVDGLGRSPAVGPSSSASTTRSWPGLGSPGSMRTSCGSPTSPNASTSPWFGWCSAVV